MRGAALAALAAGLVVAAGTHTHTPPLLRGWTTQPRKSPTKPIKRAASRAKQKARRIVACWNACQGIDTADLENGAVNLMEHMMATPDQRLQKRAEILAEILQSLAEHDFGGRLHGRDRIRAYDAICARARAVLASKS